MRSSPLGLHAICAICTNKAKAFLVTSGNSVLVSSNLLNLSKVRLSMVRGEVEKSDCSYKGLDEIKHVVLS